MCASAGVASGQIASEVLDPATELRLKTAIANGSVEGKRSALSEIRNLRSDAASRLAIPALRDKDSMVRATAASSVIFLPPNEGSAELIPLLRDKDEFVRREAAYALGEVRDFAATAPLIRLMQSDKIFEVKTAATVALGKIGDPSAIESLAAILRSRVREDDEFLRRSAARSIGQIAQIAETGDPTVVTPQNFLPDKFKDLRSGSASLSRATNVLADVLNNSKESDDTRREAAFSLGAIGDRRSADVLRRYLSSSDPYLVEICREALLKIESRNKATGSGE